MKSNPNINRLLYAGFTLFGIYKLAVANYGEAAMHFGIALAFDPFDPSITWKERPIWQRAWLVAHLALCAGAFGLEVGINDAKATLSQ